MLQKTGLRILEIALLAVFALLAGATVDAQTGTPASHPMHHQGTPMPHDNSMAGMIQGGEFDLMFIDMMILHHQGAVAMAEVALERGEHPELVAMATEIISAQEEEITQFLTWRDDWYPGAPPTSMETMMGGMGGMFGMQDMMMDPAIAAESLRAVTEQFDLAFINGMIPHHLGALMMSEMAIQQAIHPELAAAAQMMFDMQNEEIATMRSWRTAWYGIPATPVR